MSQKRKRESPEKDADQSARLYSASETIEDRKSKFVGIYSPTLSYQELQKLTQITSADHKIAAWRRESTQQSLTANKRYVTGFDDDGEKYAGKKVEKALIEAAVTGSCIVARWWGGSMLGPARFEHIDTCAREAIRQWRLDEQNEVAKKRKTEADEAARAQLIEDLQARDSNITVLRDLAAQKEQVAEASKRSIRASSQVAGDDVSSSSRAASSINHGYEDMSLERLQALDKARDATITFLLKRIDKAELKSISSTT